VLARDEQAADLTRGEPIQPSLDGKVEQTMIDAVWRLTPRQDDSGHRRPGQWLP
jgi:hypothetical protein